MVSQQQATASVSVIGGVLLYVLWSLVQTGNFLPYLSEFSPNIGNILTFLGMLSFVVGAVVAILYSIGITVISWLRKRESVVSGVTIFSWFISSSVLVLTALLLHVFRLVPLSVSLLSYSVVCSIVLYGKYKTRTRYKKYLAASDRGGKGEDPVKV